MDVNQCIITEVLSGLNRGAKHFFMEDYNMKS